MVIFKNFLRNVLIALLATALGVFHFFVIWSSFVIARFLYGLLFGFTMYCTDNNCVTHEIIDWQIFIWIAIFIAAFVIGYWFIVKSTLADVYKASLLSVPTFLIMMVIIGTPFIRSIAGAMTIAVCIGLLFYIIRRRTWPYRFIIIIFPAAAVFMCLSYILSMTGRHLF